MDRKELEAKLAAIPVEEPDEIDKAMIAMAEAENDDETITLDEYKAITDYSGKLSLRVPRSLHKELAERAKLEGVSLNQYALYKLSH